MNPVVTTCLLMTLTACTVPSPEELGLCKVSNIAGGAADAVLGDEGSCRALKTVVTHAGIQPECVQVVARPLSGGSKRTVSVSSLRQPPDRPLVIIVFPPNEWNDVVEIEALAFREQHCGGAPVAGTRETITFKQDAPVQLALRIEGRDTDGDGYADIQSGGTDCDDSNHNIWPGAPEACNSIDDDCDGIIDEDFPLLGSACEAEGRCSGVHACDASGIATACEATATAISWYVDADGDGVGSGAAIQSCPSPAQGYVNQGGDCDDGNPFIYPGAAELCDGIDNDCDGAPEPPSQCPAEGGTWVAGTVTGGSIRASFRHRLGDTVFASDVGERVIFEAHSTSFNFLGTCNGGPEGSGWYALWMTPTVEHTTYFGSSEGYLVSQERDSRNCVQHHIIDRPIRGLAGIDTGSAFEIHGITTNSFTTTLGATFIWDGSTRISFDSTATAPLYGIHGRSRSTLFTVGGHDASGPRGVEAFIYRFNANTLAWESEYIATAIPGLSRLRAVWVVNDKVAFAVGDSNAVVRWDGSHWARIPFSSTHNEILTAVLAFGSNSAYVTTEAGRVYRYDGLRWYLLFEDTNLRLYNITGSSPADLWVVGGNGESGQLRRWPR